MKFPLINKYYLVNIFVYLLIICAISGILTDWFVLFERFTYLWTLSLFLFVISELMIPMAILFTLLEIILLKLKVLKYKTLEVNVSPKVQKIVYTLAALSFAYYLWFKFYYEPILDKMLEFD